MFRNTRGRLLLHELGVLLNGPFLCCMKTAFLPSFVGAFEFNRIVWSQLRGVTGYTDDVTESIDCFFGRTCGMKALMESLEKQPVSIAFGADQCFSYCVLRSSD